MKKILFVFAAALCDTYCGTDMEYPGQFDLVEWVLFDSHTESVYEAEVTLYYNMRI